MIKIKMKMKITKEMLQGTGHRILGDGVITDSKLNFYGWGNPDKELKFVIVKGYIDDWAVYLESMDRDMTLEEVKEIGNKVPSSKIKLLVDCNDEVLSRYRD